MKDSKSEDEEKAKEADEELHKDDEETLLNTRRRLENKKTVYWLEWITETDFCKSHWRV